MNRGLGDAGITQPPGIEATLRRFGRPVFAFAPQGRLAELTATTQLVRGQVVSVALSYTYFARPAHRDHPDNLVALTPEQRQAIEQAENSGLPRWLVEQITRIRYPALWEAVRTTKAVPRGRSTALEACLVAHVNDVLRTSMPERPPLKATSTSASGRVRPEDLLDSVPITIDGTSHRGWRLNAGLGIVAVGARVEDRYLTAVYNENTAPGCQVEFVHRPFLDIARTAQ